MNQMAKPPAIQLGRALRQRGGPLRSPGGSPPIFLATIIMMTSEMIKIDQPARSCQVSKSVVPLVRQTMERTRMRRTLKERERKTPRPTMKSRRVMSMRRSSPKKRATMKSDWRELIPLHASLMPMMPVLRMTRLPLPMAGMPSR